MGFGDGATAADGVELDGSRVATERDIAGFEMEFEEDLGGLLRVLMRVESVGCCGKDDCGGGAVGEELEEI